MIVCEGAGWRGEPQAAEVGLEGNMSSETRLQSLQADWLNCWCLGVDPTFSSVLSRLVLSWLALCRNDKDREDEIALSSVPPPPPPRKSLSISLLQDDGQEQDIYESCLTQAEIQGHINLANGKR